MKTAFISDYPAGFSRFLAPLRFGFLAYVGPSPQSLNIDA